METCSKIQKKLFSGNLGDQNEKGVLAHLNACASCRQAAEENSRVTAFLRQRPTPILPNSFDAGLQSKLAAARARQEQSNAVTRWFTRAGAAASLAPRRAFSSLGLGASLAAAAALAGGFLLMPHVGNGHAPRALLSERQSVSPVAIEGIAPLPATLQQGDADFIAACSSQNAQYISTQSVADPSASALAASLDGTRAAPETSNISDASNSPAD